MKNESIALMHWINGVETAKTFIERDYCLMRARMWATYIIANGCYFDENYIAKAREHYKASELVI
jgi:hypothetical protein